VAHEILDSRRLPFPMVEFPQFFLAQVAQRGDTKREFGLGKIAGVL
jgi:hypothetical protein